MSRDNNMTMLGRAGETVVLNWFNRQGISCKVSVDQYDSQKDMIAEGKKIEVKTQVPFVFKDAFTFKENQLRKCLTSDYVYFVSVPNKTKPHHSDGKVYRIESSKMQYSEHRTKDGRKMIIVPIKQPAMQMLFVMDYSEASILQKYSVSGWN
jgi:hypothetical protein